MRQVRIVEVIDFTTMGSLTAASLTIGDLTITAESATGAVGILSVSAGYGLAVVGGSSGSPDYRVSDLEALVFDFADAPEAASYLNDQILNGDLGDGDGDGQSGESVMTPVDRPTGLWYDEVALSGLGPFSVDIQAGWAPLDEFRVAADPVSGDSFRIRKIAYCKKPEGSGLPVCDLLKLQGLLGYGLTTGK